MQTTFLGGACERRYATRGSAFAVRTVYSNLAARDVSSGGLMECARWRPRGVADVGVTGC